MKKGVWFTIDLIFEEQLSLKKERGKESQQGKQYKKCKAKTIISGIERFSNDTKRGKLQEISFAA